MKVRTFRIDVNWKVNKYYYMEANSQKEAEAKVWDLINSGVVNVWVDGFKITDDIEVKCNGEEHENGDIEYY